MDILGVAPWVIVTAAVSWGAQAVLYRDKRAQQKIDSHAQVEIHKDGLTFELLQAARAEMSNFRVEVEDLRDEVKKLRAMEQHFYHFQQSLDHLEALLFADNPEARKVAEGNARAFLNRMRRLNEAKGTIANETQIAAAKVNIVEKAINDAAEKGILDGE